jgi:hypothetical protein
MFIARKKVEGLFERLFSHSWIPLYTLISHMTIPYADAIERYHKQRRIARWLGADVLTLGVASWLVSGNFLKQSLGSLKRLVTPRFWASDDAAERKGEAARLEQLSDPIINLPPPRPIRPPSS